MKKDNLVDHIPVHYKISEWGNPPEIVYSCPKCGETFHFYSDQEKFCHTCGHKIYWDTCNRYLNPEQEKRYREIQRQYSNSAITWDQWNQFRNKFLYSLWQEFREKCQ